VALRSFARTWAAELKDQKIRVNVIHPGCIDTASLDGLPPQMRERLSAAIPLGRFGEPREIATAALFLASSDSSYISGVGLATAYVHGAILPTSRTPPA
jgi:NAD(P)-dependent dehydrogenase (short-subunit alcohol dehydrogenase family)